MGKYTRKAKMTVDVAVMDVSQSYLGVRTRAKTLALQRLQSAAAAAAARPSSKPDACYLELRSRRLEKPMQQQNSRTVRHGCGCRGDEGSGIGGGVEFFGPGTISGSIGGENLGIEASFGENNLDFEAGESERGTRESTPCSLIKDADITNTPGSTTKKTCSIALSQTARNELLADVPCARELEEFFAHEEQSMQRYFIEKYNFDFVKDSPLAGRYEWVAVRP